jgi:hypothetical protein
MMNQSAAAQSRPAQGPTSAASAPQSSQDELIRVFNTALVATQAGSQRDFSGEIFELMENPAFRSILGAVRQHARLQGVSERQAAEQIITTFRKMDRVWTDYVFQEGVDRLKNL